MVPPPSQCGRQVARAHLSSPNVRQVRLSNEKDAKAHGLTESCITSSCSSMLGS